MFGRRLSRAQPLEHETERDREKTAAEDDQEKRTGKAARQGTAVEPDLVRLRDVSRIRRDDDSPVHRRVDLAVVRERALARERQRRLATVRFDDAGVE